MDYNDLSGILQRIEENERELTEKIANLKNELSKSENNEYQLVGTNEKKDELVKLENDRNSLIVVKNKIHNTFATYNQLKVQADKSEYSGMSYDDFKNMLGELDLNRKELENKIEELTIQTKGKEENKYSLVSTNSKIEELKELKDKKQKVEIKFQRIASYLNNYNRLLRDIESLKQEEDNNVLFSRFNELIYKANRSGLPAQLIIDLMSQTFNFSTLNQDKQNDNQNIIKDQPVIQSVQASNDESQSVQVSNNESQSVQTKTREEEIYDLLSESAKRLKQALDDNNSEAIASERGYRQRLLNELNEINEERIKKQKEEQIEKIDRLLEESAKRLQSAIAENNDDAIAQERSYRQQLLNKKAEINGIELNEPKKNPVISNVENKENKENEGNVENTENTKNTENEENVENIENVESENINPINEEEAEEEIDPELEELSDGEIKDRIKDLETKRKALDDEIIKISLDSSKDFWNETYEQMGRFIEMGKEIYKLKELLPEVIENNVLEEQEEPVNQQNYNVQEEQKSKSESRKVKFKKFITAKMPKHAVRICFAVRKAISDLFNRNKTVEITGDVENEVESNVEPIIVDNVGKLDDEEQIIEIQDDEDDEITQDFTQLSDDLGKTQSDLEKMKEIMEKYRDDIKLKTGDDLKIKTI